MVGEAIRFLRGCTSTILLDLASPTLLLGKKTAFLGGLRAEAPEIEVPCIKPTRTDWKSLRYCQGCGWFFFGGRMVLVFLFPSDFGMVLDGLAMFQLAMIPQ